VRSLQCKPVKDSAVPRTLSPHRAIAMSDEIHSYTQLQQRIHDALRVQHPDWVEPNVNCPACDSY
jgi:hypothetical protein